MGLIKRQTIKGAAYSYMGALIGFLNVAILMPRFFTSDEVGLVNLLISLSAIVGQFGCFGFTNVIVRFFPYFRNPEKHHNGFPLLLLLVAVFGSLVCTGLYFASRDYLIVENLEKSKLFSDYIFLLLPLIYITIFHLLFDTYNRLLFNASFGLFVKEFFLRILNFIGIMLFYAGIFDFNQFIFYYVAAYGVPTLMILVLLIIRGNFSLKPSKELLTKDFVKQMLSVALFGIIASFSGVFVGQIDRYFVNHYCDLSATGIYSIAFYFGSMILLPGRSLIRISASVIAESFKENNLTNVETIFKKSTLNQMIIGIFFFLMIWGNIDNILQILPEDYASGKYVILFIAISHLLQMCAGVSAEIIQYSKYYRQFTVIMLILIASIVGFNMWLLPIYGITGAAIASMISFAIYLVIRFVFIKIKFGFQPYCTTHLKIILWGVIAYAISIVLPQFSNFIIDLIIRSVLMSAVFICPILFFKYSEDITNTFNKAKQFIFKKRNNE